MSEYRRGDVVSLSRAQTSRVRVATAPAVPAEPYTLDLPINGTARAFSVAGTPGETRAQLAERLLAHLLDAQTVYSAAIDETGERIVLVGPIGVAFEATATPNLALDTPEVSVLAVDSRSGGAIGPIRILEATSTLERPREFWTRVDGVLTARNLLRGRELDTSIVYDFDATWVLTVIHREGR